MAKAKTEKVSFRWGIPLLDSGFTVVPNFMFSTYSAIGVDRAEFLFILHLARYHYETALGEARPSLATLAGEMGVSRRWVRKLKLSLERKGLLRVIERSGETNVYEFSAFGRACAEAHSRAEALRNSSSDWSQSSSGWGLEGLGSERGNGGDPPGAAVGDIKKISRKLTLAVAATAGGSDVDKGKVSVASRNSSSDRGESCSGGGTRVPPPSELQFPPPRNSSSHEQQEDKKKREQQQGSVVVFSESLRTGLETIGMTPQGIERLKAVWNAAQTHKALDWVRGRVGVDNLAGYLLKLAADGLSPDVFVSPTKIERADQEGEERERENARRCWERDRQPCSTVVGDQMTYTWCRYCDVATQTD